MISDLKFALRQLLKQPGFTLVAVVTLALGLGTNTAIFSVVKAVLLQPLPYLDPDRLVMVWTDNPSLNLGIHELPPSQLDFLDWRQRATCFAQLAAVRSDAADLQRNDEVSRIGAVSVTSSFFSTLGVEPALGRGFTAEEEQPGKDKVVVVSDRFWQQEFGRDPNLLGKSIQLNNESRVVVGIMPPGFHFPRSSEMPAAYDMPEQSDLWLPLARDAGYWQDDVNRQLIVLGRLKSGLPLAQAQAQMTTLAQQVAQERPATHTGWSTHLRPLSIQVAGKARPVLFVLLGAVAFVLLIACANVAGLLLCRSTARRREMAIRSALGAGTFRVIRQLLTESVLLALLGGAGGIALAWLSLNVLLTLSPGHVPRLQEASLDGAVFAFSLFLSLATGIAFGLAPALHAAKLNLTEALNAAGRGNSERGRRISHLGLVTAQVAVAFSLLVGAALLLQSLGRLIALDPGFAKTGIHAFDITFRGERYRQGETRIAAVARIREQLSRLPGIDHVALVSHLPLGGSENLSYFLLEDRPETRAGEEPLGEHRIISTGYFQTQGIELLRGRDFEGSDASGKPLVAIVNESLARQFFPDGDAIGRRLRLKDSSDDEWCQIVGIVRDVRAAALDLKPRPAFYFAHSQFPTYWEQLTVLMRGSAAAAAGLERSARQELRRVDPLLPFTRFRAMTDLVAGAVALPRFGSILLGLFAATALILTMVGLYGVVAYTVNQRTRELGVRLVLGAERNSILGMVLRQGMAPVAAGWMLGLALSLGLGRLLSSLLFEMSPADPPTLVVASLTLIGITLLACWMPAHHASRVDPIVALRQE
ncbi:MAG: ABC transporter permease [Verrucomicrobiales bacterium]|nr:ABC transporter permease [Verrucomicrobiales bacterium]